MSLVEKAILKMQQTQRAGGSDPTQPAADRVFGTVVTTSTHKTLPPSVAAAPISDRIVAIDQVALRESGLLPPPHQERMISQQYRQIKRPLLANAAGRGVPKLPNGMLIMMASAVPGEGKTFTSLNLAFSMTLEKDMRVLLVDADLPKPHISNLLGVEEEPGLLDALRDSSVDVERLILPTNVRGLFLLPAGKDPENATELLASDHMRQLAAQLIERDPKRIVIFDSPPLLLTTESQALAQVVGQIVLVVRAGVTLHRTVLDAVSVIGAGKSVSLVLNQSTTTPPASYSYYGYGYGDAQNTRRPDA